mmetsp:Transcript_87696/g.234808  ORF Transcript_87696/g.234808 Transcript_87696/m.234808 type:complete len:326 (-) Transcript_87696:318-1295(-)
MGQDAARPVPGGFPHTRRPPVHPRQAHADDVDRVVRSLGGHGDVDSKDASARDQLPSPLAKLLKPGVVGFEILAELTVVNAFLVRRLQRQLQDDDIELHSALRHDLHLIQHARPLQHRADLRSRAVSGVPRRQLRLPHGLLHHHHLRRPGRRASKPPLPVPAVHVQHRLPPGKPGHHPPRHFPGRVPACSDAQVVVDCDLHPAFRDGKLAGIADCGVALVLGAAGRLLFFASPHSVHQHPGMREVRGELFFDHGLQQDRRPQRVEANHRCIPEGIQEHTWNSVALSSNNANRTIGLCCLQAIHQSTPQNLYRIHCLWRSKPSHRH